MWYKMMFAVAGLFFFVSAGCSTMSTSIPEGQPPLRALSTEATYDIVGPAEGTSSGVTLLGFIPLTRERKAGFIAGRRTFFGTPTADRLPANRIMQAAIYHAIESVPNADALIAPRYSAQTTNFLIIQSQTITVKGKAIRYIPAQ